MHPVLQRNGVEVRDRSRILVQVGHITTYATGGNNYFFHYIVPSSDLSKLLTKLTKVRARAKKCTKILLVFWSMGELAFKIYSSN